MTNRTPALDALADTFAKHADDRLLVLADGTEVKYRDFWNQAENMAHGLRSLGVPAGGRLLIKLANSQHLLALYLACAIGGYVACPNDPETPQPRLATLKSILQPALVVDEGVLATLLQPAPKDGGFGAGLADEEFLVVFSSGSTGQPKGIVHSLATMTASATSFAQLSGMGADSIVYHHFPMFYMAGIFNMFFAPMVAGGSIVVGPRFSKLQMLRFWELPVKYGVNCLTVTPTMALSLCELYRRNEPVLQLLAQAQSVIATGSVLYPSVAERFQKIFRVPLRTCYGVTEVGGTVTFQSWEDALASQSMGSWAPNTEIRAGDEAAPAEILVKTPFMAKGYLTREGMTGVADAEGFFHTGDVGYVKDGLLFYSGRQHDLVKKGGEFVSTQTIENLALSCGKVTDVAAVGVPDEFWGMRVVLFYVAEREADVPEILAEFNRVFERELRDIERPDKFIPVPWMPKSSIGKILKRELVDTYTIGRTAAP